MFVVGFDPIAAGLVASLSRPGGNATGMTLISSTLGQKRLEVLRELVPKASVVGLLINPHSPDTGPEIASVQMGAQTLGLQLEMFNASTPDEIEFAFASIASRRPDALLVGTDAFLLNETRPDRFARCVSKASCDLSVSRLCSIGRSYQFRNRHCEFLPPSRHLRRAYSKARKQPICRCSSRRYLSLLSIVEPLTSWVLLFRPRCTPVPTR